MEQTFKKAASRRVGVAGCIGIVSLLGLATSAHAVTLFQIDASPSGAHLDLTGATNTTTDGAEVLSPNDVTISVVGASDFASGFANISPSGSASLNTLIFTPLSAAAFTGFSFRGQDAGSNQTIDVTVTDQANQTESFSFTQAKANQDFTRFGIIAAQPGETIKSVEIQNSGAGFKEAKQFEFTLAAVPEPASWAMMITGFGLVGAALRRGRTGAAVEA
jgi:hypothetical protein